MRATFTQLFINGAILTHYKGIHSINVEKGQQVDFGQRMLLI